MYLRKRNGVYHWRRKLPDAVSRKLGKIELVRSLRTNDRRVAKKRAARLAIASEQVYILAMTNKRMTTKEINELACQWLEDALADDEEFRMSLGPYEAGYSEPQQYVDGVDTDLSALNELLGETTEALSRNKLSMANPLLNEVLTKAGLSLSDDSPERIELAKTLLRALAEFFRIVKRRRVGDYTVHAHDPLFSAVLGVGQASARTVDPATESMLLSELVVLYEEAKLKDGVWGSESTRRNSIPRIHTFIEIVGDRPFETVDRNMIRDYREYLLDELDLSPNTVGQCFRVVGAMFNWAKNEELTAKDNPLKGLAPKGQKGTRLAYMPDDLEALFKTPLFTGHLSKKHRERVGRIVVKDFKYWFPLVALHTGMRLEEIAQLKTDDILEEEGIPVINIVKSKTSAGERIVPIHPRLIDLGFMDYVKAQKKGQLWPELNQSSEGHFSPLFAKWWPFYRRSQGLDKEGLVFHSFRHTFVSWLQKVNVPADRLKLIVGHADQSVTYGVYGGKMISAKDKLDAIKDIDFGVDLSHLRP